ncbi:MAG TPA: hypothetical protein DCX95_06530 [Elusimicrobia bacterium]|nr:hypothetical protein [Elusimicrobiota bacterium]
MDWNYVSFFDLTPFILYVGAVFVFWKFFLKKKNILFTILFGTFFIVAFIFILITLKTEITERKYKVEILTQGEIVEGLIGASTHDMSPRGWEIVYSFSINGKKYIGYQRSIKDYCYQLKRSNKIKVVYHPDNPSYNFEIRTFINDPYNKQLFNEHKKGNFIMNFAEKNNIDLNNYTFEEWLKLRKAR